jgi:hypothetical protein
MSGDTTKVNLWADADVYVAAIGATVPADAATPFNGSWTLAGLLDGDQGFAEDRNQDEKDHYAWGGILVATTRSKFKLSKKFTVLEDNVQTRALIWPGSTSTSTIVPVPTDILVAFETRRGGIVRRKITSNRAQVTVDGTITDNETDMTAVTLVATIYPDPTTKELFIEQGKPTITSIAITPLTLALSLAGAKIKTLVATATYSDTTTGNVTASVQWSSSVPANATVSAGYVTGLVAGVTNVSCSLGGVTSTAPCVVTVGA